MSVVLQYGHEYNHADYNLTLTQGTVFNISLIIKEKDKIDSVSSCSWLRYLEWVWCYVQYGHEHSHADHINISLIIEAKYKTNSVSSLSWLRYSEWVWCYTMVMATVTEASTTVTEAQSTVRLNHLTSPPLGWLS